MKQGHNQEAPSAQPFGPLAEPNQQRRSYATWLLQAPRPLAFAFSGGGGHGSTQVGMLAALAEAGIEPDLIVGTSVGALNGALAAADMSTAAEKLGEIWLSMNYATVFGSDRPGLKQLSMATHLAKSRSSLLSNTQILSLLDRYSPAKTIEELATPLAIVATDLLSGQVELFTEGPLTPALAASTAIPGLLPPVEIAGRRYVDGGVVATFPTRQARLMGAQTVVLLDASPADPLAEIPKKLVASLIHAASLSSRAQLGPSIDSDSVGCPVVRMPGSTPPESSSFDFGHPAQRINASYHRSQGFLNGPCPL